MLTDAQIRNAKPTGKPYRLSDENNLYVFITKTGIKSFRLDTTVYGKRRTIVIGRYPSTSLSLARMQANNIRHEIMQGSYRANKEDKNKHVFRNIAEEWGALKIASWSPMDNTKRRLEMHIYPTIGDLPIVDITKQDLLKILRRAESLSESGEMPRRVLSILGRIYRYSMLLGYCETDLTYGLIDALKPPKKGHFKAITEPKELLSLWQAINLYPTLIVKNALKMAMLTAVRPGELRAMKWSDIDFKTKQWSYTINKTKTPHIVPLSTSALSLLDELKEITGSRTYVFSSLREYDDRPISDMTMLMALQRMGFNITVHGFRASFRTIMDEVLGYPPHYLEQQLGHVVRDPLGAAYNRTSHLKQRVEMMQAWADWLDRI